MPQREFYIDPLHGDSSYDGTTSAANISGSAGPFASLTDVLWNGGDGSTKGGTGDIFYLVASTGDLILPTDGYYSYDFQDTARWGYNTYNAILEDGYKVPPTFIGVDTNLEPLDNIENLGKKDSPRYTIYWHNTSGTQYEFFNARGTHFWNNVAWISTSTGSRNGLMYYYTSGGNGPYYNNCKFDFSQSQSNYSNDLFSSSNPSSSFKHCVFLGPGAASGMDATRIGAAYGQHSNFIGNVFDGWDRCIRHVTGTIVITDNIFTNSNKGVYMDSGPSTQGVLTISNNLFYNLDDSAIDCNSQTRNPCLTYHNLFVDVGGYGVEGGSNFAIYTSSGQGAYLAKNRVERNVFQNCTQGVFDTNIPTSFLGVTGDGCFNSWVNNVEVTGLTLTMDSNHGITLELIPSSVFMKNSKDLFGATLSSPSTPLGKFFNTGVSGDSSGGGSSEESEQGRITS